MTRTQTKDERLHLRLTSAQRARIDRAAAVEGRTVTDFALMALQDRADTVLADRRLFELDEQAWRAFQRQLDRRVQAKPRLAELLERKPPAE